jgi:SAM-dependent methyltransferase
VVGLDVSHEALRRAGGLDGAAVYIQGACDAALPFPMSCFDAVYCAEVIEHLLDPETMVHECYRVLKPSGIFFVTTPYHGLIKNVAIAAATFDRHFNATGPHIRFFTRKALRGLLKRNGFEVERVSYLGRFWPLWMNMVVCARKP